MKKFLNLILCFVVAIIACALTSCSDGSKNNGQNTQNEEYYRAIGYHSITYDKYISIISDKENIVSITTTKCMVKHNSKITITHNETLDDDFVSNNGNFVNFKTGIVLSSFKVNDKTYETNDATITVKNDLEIESNLSNFHTLGVAINAICNRTPEKLDLSHKFDNIETQLENCLYFYASDPQIQNFSQDNLIASTSIISSTENIPYSDQFNLVVSAEIFTDSSDVFIYLILRDSENKFYLHEIEVGSNFLDKEITISKLSNNNSNLNKIKLTLSHDITVKDEY